MKHGISLEDNISSACLRKLPAFYRNRLLITTLTRAPTVPILKHIIQVDASILFFEDLFQYYPPTYVCVFQVLPFLRVFPPKPPYAPLLSPVRATCHNVFILLDLITRKLFGENSDHIAPRCAVLVLPCYRPRHLPQIHILVYSQTMLLSQDQVSHPYKTTERLYIYIFYFILL